MDRPSDYWPIRELKEGTEQREVEKRHEDYFRV